jgi:hypothetical protein
MDSDKISVNSDDEEGVQYGTGRNIKIIRKSGKRYVIYNGNRYRIDTKASDETIIDKLDEIMRLIRQKKKKRSNKRYKSGQKNQKVEVTGIGSSVPLLDKIVIQNLQKELIEERKKQYEPKYVPLALPTSSTSVALNGNNAVLMLPNGKQMPVDINRVKYMLELEENMDEIKKDHEKLMHEYEETRKKLEQDFNQKLADKASEQEEELIDLYLKFKDKLKEQVEVVEKGITLTNVSNYLEKHKGRLPTYVHEIFPHKPFYLDGERVKFVGNNIRIGNKQIENIDFIKTLKPDDLMTIHKFFNGDVRFKDNYSKDFEKSIKPIREIVNDIYGPDPVYENVSVSNIQADETEENIPGLETIPETAEPALVSNNQAEPAPVSQIDKDIKIIQDRLAEADFTENSKEELEELLKSLQDEKSNLQSGDGVVSADGLFSNEIARLMSDVDQFKGVFAVDQIPSTMTGSTYSFIANTEPISVPTGHWIAVYVTPTTLEYYDSFGNDPDDIMKNKLKSLGSGRQFKINKCKHQSVTSSNCGWFAIKFILDRIAGRTFKDCTGYAKLEKLVNKSGEKAINEFKKKIHEFGVI